MESILNCSNLYPENLLTLVGHQSHHPVYTTSCELTGMSVKIIAKTTSLQVWVCSIDFVVAFHQLHELCR